MNKYITLAVVSGFVLSWILPNHYFPWPSAYQDFAGFMSLMVLGVGLAFNFPVRARREIVFFILLAVIPLVQYSVGLIYFFGTAFIAFLYVLGFSFALVVGYSFSSDPVGRRCLLNAIAVALVVGAVVSVWIALQQWLMLSGSIWVVDLPYGERPFANMAQPNNLATLLCMAVAATCYLYEKSCLGRLAASLLVAFLLFGVALTQSRTPWLGLLVVSIFWFWKSSVYRAKVGYVVVCAWLVYFALCVWGVPEIADALLLKSTSLAERVQGLQRLALWEQFWHAIWQGPWWGYGWGQVALAQASVAHTYPSLVISAQAHNIFLDLMLWNGPYLGLIAIFFGVFGLLKLICNVSSLDGIFALSAAGFLLIHGLLEFPLEYAFFLLPLGLLLGSAAVEGASIPGAYISRKLTLVFLGFSFLVFSWVWAEYRILEEDYRLMRFEAARIGTLRAEKPAPDVVLLTQIREFIRFARTEPGQSMSKDELELMRKAAYMPPHAPSLLRYAIALAINGEVDLSLVQLQLIRDVHGKQAYDNSVEHLKTLRPIYPEINALFEKL